MDVTVFSNGDPIPQAKTAKEWEDAGKNNQPAWCYYENSAANGAKFGKLYNGHAIIDPRGLAPSGWHIPNISEWIILIDFLGSESGAKKMKAINDWENNGGGTNEIGFSAYPGGQRYSDGTFNWVGKGSFFWSATVGRENCSSCNWELRAVQIFSQSNSMQKNSVAGKESGFSVRLLKD